MLFWSLVLSVSAMASVLLAFTGQGGPVNALALTVFPILIVLAVLLAVGALVRKKRNE